MARFRPPLNEGAARGERAVVDDAAPHAVDETAIGAEGAGGLYRDRAVVDDGPVVADTSGVIASGIGLDCRAGEVERCPDGVDDDDLDVPDTAATLDCLQCPVVRQGRPGRRAAGDAAQPGVSVAAIAENHDAARVDRAVGEKGEPAAR